MSVSRIHLHLSDVQGLSRLTIDGVTGTAALVEQLHYAIARVSGPTLPARNGRMRGISGLVYRSIHGITGLVGHSIDFGFRQIVPRLPGAASTPQRDRFLAIVNGVLGDHLETEDNPLALPMQLRHRGHALASDFRLWPGELSAPRRKLLVFMHGLCMTDHDWAQLSSKVEQLDDVTPVQLFYNSGRSIARNGQELADLLETLVGSQPEACEELVLIGHSMGGLLARSAVHHARLAGQVWTDRLSRLITLGSPHHGAPLERIGHQIDRALALTPFSRPFTRLGRIRSAGILDLRDGRLLESRLPDEQAPGNGDTDALLPPQIRMYAIAGTLADTARGLKSATLGDGLVTVDSALGQQLPDQQRPPHQRRKVMTQAGHLGLLSHPEVARQIIEWLQDD